MFLNKDAIMGMTSEWAELSNEWAEPGAVARLLTLCARAFDHKVAFGPPHSKYEGLRLTFKLFCASAKCVWRRNPAGGYLFDGFRWEKSFLEGLKGLPQRRLRHPD